MTYRYLSLGAIVFSILLTGCKFDEPQMPETTGPEPLPWLVIGKDSVSAGEYLGIGVGSSAEEAYQAVLDLQQPKGVGYLNIVSNQSSDIAALEGRIPLYSYILLDEQRGTDSGVQITVESGKVKSIYLNSGRQLSAWPEKGSAAASVREGDAVEALCGKMVNISKNKSYTPKFERISLLTKDLSKPFDPVMAQSPQWYFAYLKEDGERLEQVQIHLEGGKVSYVIVTLMSKWGVE